jgi:UPF0716 protein FxsA
MVGPGPYASAMAPLLLALFIVVPIVELYVIVQIGQAIGILPTLALLVLDGFLGMALLRSQGGRAWQRFNLALAEGRVPAREVFDGAMVILGGALLLTPGFVTDVFGLILLIPPTRDLARGVLGAMARRRIGFGWRISTFGSAPRQAPGPPPRPGRRYDYEGSAREVREHELPERGDELR